MNYKKYFDHNFYLNNYDDLKRIIKNKDKAWEHANNHGWKENRTIFSNKKINNDFINFKKNKTNEIKITHVKIDNKIQNDIIQKHQKKN